MKTTIFRIGKILGFIASFYLWISFAYITLDRSPEAQKLTGGGFLPHKVTFFILAAIILLFFRNQIFTRKMSIANVVSKIVFTLALFLAFIIAVV